EPLSAESRHSMGLAGRLAHALLARTQRYVLRRADPVVAISREVEQMLASRGVDPARIARIPNGIHLGRFRPASAEEKAQLRTQLSIPQEATVVLFVGRLSKAKGILRLVELWPRIIARHPMLQLLIVGSGGGSFDDCELELARLIREQHMAGHARMSGPTDRVQDYLRAADVFI